MNKLSPRILVVSNLVYFFVFLLVSCAPNNEAESNIVSGFEARQIHGIYEDVILLDVRSQEEFDTFHLEDSMLIPAGEIESKLHGLNKEAIFIVYCKAGIRSARVVEILLENGFENVYDMQSIDNWLSPLERELIKQIDNLTSLIDEFEEKSQPILPPEDFIVPQGAKICGYCTGCAEYHLIWDDIHFEDHVHQYTPCGDCDDVENCAQGNCDECEHEGDCEQFFHQHNEECDHPPDE